MLPTETLHLKIKDATKTHSYFLESWQMFGVQYQGVMDFLLSTDRKSNLYEEENQGREWGDMVHNMFQMQDFHMSRM